MQHPAYSQTICEHRSVIPDHWHWPSRNQSLAVCCECWERRWWSCRQPVKWTELRSAQTPLLPDKRWFPEISTDTVDINKVLLTAQNSHVCLPIYSTFIFPSLSLSLSLSFSCSSSSFFFFFFFRRRGCSSWASALWRRGVRRLEGGLWRRYFCCWYNQLIYSYQFTKLVQWLTHFRAYPSSSCLISAGQNYSKRMQNVQFSIKTTHTTTPTTMNHSHFKWVYHCYLMSCTGW